MSAMPNSGSGVSPLKSKDTQRRDAASTIATSLSIDREDLELSPFNQLGGRGNLSAIALAKAEAHQLFGDKLLPLLHELNQTLTA